MKCLNETYNNEASLLNTILNNDLVKYTSSLIGNEYIIFNIYAVDDTVDQYDAFLNEYLKIYSIYNNTLLQDSDIFKDDGNPEITNPEIFNNIINNNFIPYLNSKIKKFHISNDALAVCYKQVNNQVKKLYNIIKQYSTGNFALNINQSHSNIGTIVYPFQLLNKIPFFNLNKISIQEYNYNDFKNKASEFILENNDLIITFDRDNNILQSGICKDDGSYITEYNQKYTQIYIETIQNAITDILKNFNSYITYKEWNDIKFPIISVSLVIDFYDAINIKPPTFMFKNSKSDNICEDIKDFYIFDKIYIITRIQQVMYKFHSDKHKIIYSPLIDNIYKGDNYTLIKNRHTIPYCINNMYKDLIKLFQEKADPVTSTQFQLITKFISNFLILSQLKITRIRVGDDGTLFNFNAQLKLNTIFYKMYKIYQFIQNEYQNILKLYSHKQAYNYLKNCNLRIDALNKILKLHE